MYRRVHTCLYLALVLVTRCYPSFPTAQFRWPCAECYGPFQIPLGLFPSLIREVFFCRRSRRSIDFCCDSGLCLWNAWLARRNVPIHALNEYLHNLVTGISNVRQFVQMWTSFSCINSPDDQQNLVDTIQVCTLINNIYTMYLHVRSQTMEGRVSISIFIWSPVIFASSLPSM